MKVRYIILVLIFMCFTEAIAALPPFFQGKREIETILSSPELQECIPAGDIIAQITKTPIGYMIITNKRIVAVLVKYPPSDLIGPVRFTLEFHTLTAFNEASAN